MYHLVYVSSAINPFDEPSLKELLAVSRRNNEGVGLTGMLLYVGGNFIQVLEGEEKEVVDMHLRIARDPRHRGMIVLLRGEIQERDFDQWSMGFRQVNVEEGSSLPGYNDFLNRAVDPARHGSGVLRLLEHFKKINR